VASRRRQQIGQMSVPALAGWLFADLLLVLFVVSLASLPILPKPKARAAPHPHPTPHPAAAEVLDRVPVSIPVHVPPIEVEDGASRAAAIAQIMAMLNHQLALEHLTNRRAGFVLIFASGPLDGTGPAITAAKAVLDAISRGSGVFHNTSGAAYWQGAGNFFEFRIFFFAQAG
jgi:hypothetical protein